MNKSKKIFDFMLKGFGYCFIVYAAGMLLAQGNLLNKPIISGLMTMRSGTTWDHLGDSWVPATDSEEDIGSSSVRLKTVYADSVDASASLNFSGTIDGNLVSETDGTDDLGSSSVAWLHAYFDTVVVNERLDPDADAGADMGTAALRWNTGYFDELFPNKGANVASATTSFTLGSDGNYYVVTGTAQIDSIAAQSAGKFVYLQTAAACTLVDGGNLKLSGNFNATADDIITLISDGTDWYEVSRSAN